MGSTERLLADLRVAFAECRDPSTQSDQYQYLFTRASAKLEELSRTLAKESRIKAGLFTEIEHCRQDWAMRYSELDSKYQRLREQKRPASPGVHWCPGCTAQQNSSYEKMRSRHSDPRPYYPMASGALPVPEPGLGSPPRRTRATPSPEPAIPRADYLRRDIERERLREEREAKDRKLDKAAEMSRLAARFEKRPGQQPRVPCQPFQHYDFAVRMGIADGNAASGGAYRSRRFTPGFTSAGGGAGFGFGGFPVR